VTPTAAANQVSAFDATPDPAAMTLYFTGLANDPTKPPLAGVYSAPADGSNMTPAVVQAGAPYVAPWGISSSTDGKKLYVADPGADITLDANGNQIAGGSDAGVIFVQSTMGGAPTPLMGSAGFEPRSVEVHSENNNDVIYFSGRNPANGKVGVYTLPAAGAAMPTPVLEGAPLVDPGGLAIDANKTVYVVDCIGSGSGLAQIVTIKAGVPATITDLHVGFPAGIALSLDEKNLYLSSLDPVKATDVLLEIDVANPTMMTPITTNIASNTDAAGLHRAHTKNVFAWADSSAGPMGPTAGGGRVYVVK
jgi:hypothetical protein